MKTFDYPQTKITTNLEGFSFSDYAVSFINIFFASITEVKSRYLNINFEETADNPECVKDKGSQDHVERVFAYELYHQWSILLNTDDWILNGEAGKYLQWFYKNRKKTYLNQKFPDLVQYYKDNSIEDSHMIVCEIKRDYDDNIKNGIEDDLIKLVGFTCSPKNDKSDGRFFPPYACGIFLVIGHDFSVLQKHLNVTHKYRNGEWEIYNEISSEEAKKIICVLCDEKDSKINVQYQSLYNIVRDELNKRQVNRKK